MTIHSGRLPDSMKALDDLQALHQLLVLQLRRGVGELFAQVAGDLARRSIDAQHLVDGLGADHRP